MCVEGGHIQNLNSCARDEEPLIVYPVDWGWGKVFMSFDIARTRFFTIGRMLDGDIGAEILLVI